MEKEFEYEYNPIKELKNGDESSKVIWSTKSINLAIDGLQKGMQLKSNPFIGKNTKLLKPDLVYKRTKEEIDDYIKCKTDPIYFASKCFLMTPEGLQACVLRDYQEDYLKHLQKNRFSILLAARQSGKCEHLLSKILIKVYNSNSFYDYLIKYYNNISKDNLYGIFEIPMFELFKFKSKSTIDKIRFYLYKILYKLTY